jgi:hydroxymethylpyrimidine pyrophosphatase-like HAD family hydrolase
MKYFCMDLDNTIIYSYRREIGSEKVLVETMDGKELSYMTVCAYELLKKVAQSKIVVPVTTRSMNQYLRIDFGSDVPIKYALAANGGILLEQGKMNQCWFETTRELVKDADCELEKSVALLAEDPAVYLEIRKVDGLFIYTKSSNSIVTVEKLAAQLDLNKVYVDWNGEKVYVFPQILNKGASLQRFRQYCGEGNSFIAAGDSKFDIPMMLAADVGLCPEGLEFEKRTSIHSFARKHFTEELLQYVLAW